MRKQEFVFGVIVLVQIVVIAVVGVVMYWYSITSTTANNGPDFSTLPMERPASLQQVRFDDYDTAGYHVKPEWTGEPVKAIQVTTSESDNPVEHTCSAASGESATGYLF